MAIETLASLAISAGHDILAPRVSNDAEYSLAEARRGTAGYDLLTGGYNSIAGPAVTERTAMAVSAVYACVNLVSGAIASIPIHVYERPKNTQDSPVRVDHDYWWLLNEQPTPLMSAAVFWTWVMEALQLGGDGFALIIRNVRMQVTELIPLDPRQVIVDKRDGDLIYYVCLDGKVFSVSGDDVLHIPGAGFDGLRSMSVVRYAAKQAIGTSLAAAEYNARFFSNNARPDVVLTTDGDLEEEQIDQIRDSWQKRYGGLENQHMPAVLFGGLKLQPYSMTAEDAQLIETMQWQVEDVCRFFGVNPFMIGHSEKTTSWGSGVESIGIAFVKYTLGRHLVKLKQELNRKFWPRSVRYFFECITAGLERGDIKTRYEAHRLALGGSTGPGWMTPNEIRRLENLPSIEGGDKLTDWSKSESSSKTPQNPDKQIQLPGPTKGHEGSDDLSL